MIRAEIFEAFQRAPSADGPDVRTATTLRRIYKAAFSTMKVKDDPILRKLQKKGVLRVLTDILTEHESYEKTPGLVKGRSPDQAFTYIEENRE